MATSALSFKNLGMRSTMLVVPWYFLRRSVSSFFGPEDNPDPIPLPSCQPVTVFGWPAGKEVTTGFRDAWRVPGGGTHIVQAV